MYPSVKRPKRKSAADLAALANVERLKDRRDYRQSLIQRLGCAKSTTRNGAIEQALAVVEQQIKALRQRETS